MLGGPAGAQSLTPERLAQMRAAALEARAANVARQEAEARARRDAVMAYALRPEADALFDEQMQPTARTHREACAEGVSQACTDLARLYWDGSGTWQDLPLAEALLNAGCEAGHEGACTAFAQFTDTEALEFETLRPDLPFLIELCSAGEGKACLQLS